MGCDGLQCLERAAERVMNSTENQDSLKARRYLTGFNKGSKMWRMADREHQRRGGDGLKRGFIQGRGNTGQDVGDRSERRDDWTVGAESKGVRPGRFCFKRQCLPYLEKVR